MENFYKHIRIKCSNIPDEGSRLFTEGKVYKQEHSDFGGQVYIEDDLGFIRCVGKHNKNMSFVLGYSSTGEISKAYFEPMEKGISK